MRGSDFLNVLMSSDLTGMILMTVWIDWTYFQGL